MADPDNGIPWVLTSWTRAPKTEAKNKLRGQKARNVFRIASHRNLKYKIKAKSVSTNLRKINNVNDENSEGVNKVFLNIQEEPTHFSKGLALEHLQKQLVPQQHQENGSVNAAEATSLVAQLYI
ncbi:ribosomal biogenesis factor-like [Echinops telfairi]|uniref:Ribosomal biogenesis factor-like n=1 Tax=Echinops telfairi TaxID=9371 RepID=A0ABM0ZQ38_ECHTE|nr:ribosomal biogenesis factor-like [Echinops telfairi]